MEIKTEHSLRNQGVCQMETEYVSADPWPDGRGYWMLRRRRCQKRGTVPGRV